MATFLSPGVYVLEQPGSPPIAGVGTSTAGFIGVVDPAPTPAPGEEDIKLELITNFSQFVAKFGDFSETNKALAHGVFGFFNNGGTACWVAGLKALTDAGDALTKFEAIDEIAIVAAPGVEDNSVRTAIIDHCFKMQDRFAIVDPIANPDDYTVDKIKGGISVNDDKKGFAALYFPRILVADPLNPGDTTYVYPSGHMAGVYARVDATRGVHKAPANVGIVGSQGLEHRLSRNNQDLLNPDGINLIRSFDGNITVWGARTLGGDNNGEFKYINVRRLMNFLRESIEEGTQFVVFEPNSPALWQRITRTVSGFLSNVWRDGALFGNSPEQAFFVKCNEETNPPEVREAGQVVTEIGVAIVKPAECVIFKISQLTGSE